MPVPTASERPSKIVLITDPKELEPYQMASWAPRNLEGGIVTSPDDIVHALSDAQGRVIGLVRYHAHHDGHLFYPDAVHPAAVNRRRSAKFSFGFLGCIPLWVYQLLHLDPLLGNMSPYMKVIQGDRELSA